MQGKISINRRYSNQKVNPDIIISVVDESSSVHFLEIVVEPEIFGLVVTGESYKECEFELANIERIGKKHEHKTEEISLPDNYFTFRKNNEDGVKQYLAQFEVDGWMASTYDFMNSNRIKHSTNTIIIGFDRYI